MTKWLLTIGCVALVLPARAALDIDENFSTDPLATSRWTVGIGNSLPFTWNSNPPGFAGDAPGSLSVHLDSSQPTSRLQRPLGVTLTDTDDFVLTVQFSFAVISAPANQGVQMAFGLINSAATGGDRTGSVSNFTSDNVFHTVEFNYFPNLSTFQQDTPGPTLTTAVFGARKNGGDAFSNFASLFGQDSDLGGNVTGIKELPQAVVLQATLSYSGSSKLLTLAIHQVNNDGSFTLLNTGVPPLNLQNPGGFSNYDGSFPFSVDSLAIIAYHDGFTTAGNPSLVADMTFERFRISSPVPEPRVAALLIMAVASMQARRRWRER